MPKAWKRKCLMCDGAGHEPIPCVDCGQPASARGVNPIRALCDACAHPCALCGHGTPPSDRLRFDGAAVAHVECGISFSVDSIVAENLEGAVGANDTAGALGAERTYVRVFERTYGRTPGAFVEGRLMPAVSERTIEIMRRDGYVPVAEALRLSGVAGSTVYRWISTKQVEFRKSGTLYFVYLASLATLCPQVKSQLERERLAAAVQAPRVVEAQR